MSPRAVWGRGAAARWAAARWAATFVLLAGLFPVAASGETPGAPAHDPDQPIEVTADTLEVDQQKSLAVFRGNVDAVQGEMHLQADILTVHYSGTQNAQGTRISRIDAEGRVFVSSPSETAQGNTGVYDVTAGTIRLDGSVVLTRGENVVRGEQLLMDLNTGLSRVESASPEAGGERVHGVFMPENEEVPSGTEAAP